MITEDESHRFVSDADKNVYSDKYTKLETESKLSELETKVTNAYKAEKGRILQLERICCC